MFDASRRTRGLEPRWNALYGVVGVVLVVLWGMEIAVSGPPVRRALEAAGILVLFGRMRSRSRRPCHGPLATVQPDRPRAA